MRALVKTVAGPGLTAMTCPDPTAGPNDVSERTDACGLGGNPGKGEEVSDGVRYLPFEGQQVRPAMDAIVDLMAEIVPPDLKPQQAAA